MAKGNSTPFNRRQVIAAGGVFGAAGLLPKRVLASKARRAPNILFILADDLGYADLGCFGARGIRTPNLDRLAQGGVRLTHAYANSPVCSPTRLALATGQYQYRLPAGLVEPFSAGAWGDQAIPKGHPTMQGELQKTGYRTALVGKWHLGDTPAGGPLAHGYSEFFGFLPGGMDYFTHEYGKQRLRLGDELAAPREGYLTTILADETIARMQRYAKGPEPFLISLHLSAPHWPWEGPEDSRLGTKAGQHDHGSLAIYTAMVESMDRNIGRILTELEALGIADETIVVFTSDNGGERFSDMWPLRGRKGLLLEGGIRVPTIMRYPAKVIGGQHNDLPNLTMDWMPTFLEAAGVASGRRPASDGIALIPAIAGLSTPPKRDLYWRFQGHNQRAVRSGRWKFFEIDGNRFLYDLAADPMERANRAKAEPDILKRLADQYDIWNMDMVRDASIPGLCDHAKDWGEPLNTGPGTNCKPPRAE